MVAHVCTAKSIRSTQNNEQMKDTRKDTKYAEIAYLEVAMAHMYEDRFRQAYPLKLLRWIFFSRDNDILIPRHLDKT